jgi:hypothetical protein
VSGIGRDLQGGQNSEAPIAFSKLPFEQILNLRGFFDLGASLSSNYHSDDDEPPSRAGSFS